MPSRASGSAFAWLAVLRSPSTPPVNASTKGHGLKQSRAYTHGSAMFRTRFALPLGHERRVLLRDGSESSGRTNVVSSYRSGVQAKRRAYEQRARRLSRPRGAERVPHTLYQMRTRHKSIQAKGSSLTLLSHLTFE